MNTFTTVVDKTSALLHYCTSRHSWKFSTECQSYLVTAKYDACSETSILSGYNFDALVGVKTEIRCLGSGEGRHPPLVHQECDEQMS